MNKGIHWPEAKCTEQPMKSHLLSEEEESKRNNTDWSSERRQRIIGDGMAEEMDGEDDAEKACKKTGNTKLEKEWVVQSLTCIRGIKECS